MTSLDPTALLRAGPFGVLLATAIAVAEALRGRVITSTEALLTWSMLGIGAIGYAMFVESRSTRILEDVRHTEAEKEQRAALLAALERANGALDRNTEALIRIGERLASQEKLYEVVSRLGDIADRLDSEDDGGE